MYTKTIDTLTLQHSTEKDASLHVLYVQLYPRVLLYNSMHYIIYHAAGLAYGVGFGPAATMVEGKSDNVVLFSILY